MPRLLRQNAIAHLGGKCVRCGFSDVRALQVDHVNGGGKRERKRYTGWYRYADVLKYAPGIKYQCLCANCNWIKRAERNEQPYAERITRQ